MNSFTYQPIMKVDIYNQCSSFKLTNRERFWINMTCSKESDMKVDAGSMTSAELTSPFVAFEGSLMYQLQKKMSNLMINSSQYAHYFSLLGNLKVIKCFVRAHD
jgi:hypothetical protein